MSVIKVQTTAIAGVIVAQFHKDVATAAAHGMRTAATVATKIQALIVAQYGNPKGASVDLTGGGSATLAGSTGPTFEQYKADLKALDAIAKERKLVDGQYFRRAYAAALKALYGELPVSMDAAAVQKRAQREARDKLVADTLKKAKESQTMQAVSNPVGAPVGQTQEHEPSESEKLEQLVTRVGVFETLYACLRILETEESTKGACVHMRKMADKAKAEATKADAAARLKAIKPDANALAQDSAKETLSAK